MARRERAGAGRRASRSAARPPSFPPRQGWVDRAAAVRADGMGAIADAVLGRWFRPSFHDDAPRGRRALPRRCSSSTPAEGYAACCDALADVDLTSRLGGDRRAARSSSPARDDPVVPPAAGDALAAAIPDAAHTVVEGAAHIANVEQPDAFTAALLRHLSEEREDA